VSREQLNGRSDNSLSRGQWSRQRIVTQAAGRLVTISFFMPRFSKRNCAQESNHEEENLGPRSSRIRNGSDGNHLKADRARSTRTTLSSADLRKLAVWPGVA
jgi:hypothetical protein